MKLHEYCLEDPDFSAYYQKIIKLKEGGPDRGKYLALGQAIIERRQALGINMEIREDRMRDLADSTIERLSMERWGIEAVLQQRYLEVENAGGGKRGNEIIRIVVQCLEWDANRGAIEFLTKIQTELGVDILSRKFNDNEGIPRTVREHLDSSVEESYGHPAWSGVNFRY